MRQRSTDGQCAATLKLLADQSRLTVLRALLDGPRSAGELASLLDIEQTLLSHHLRGLRDAGLVLSVREGRHVIYRLAPAVAVRAPHDELDLGCCRLSFHSPSRSVS
ncbi:MAG: ArsR/SmtB family transcription factor [Nevskiales bacterium]